MKIQLRDYQKPKVSEAIESIKSGNKTVLVGSPGSGKTEMSIYIIESLIKSNFVNKVLVFAHSTNVLKSNFKDRFNNYNFDFNNKVEITIPQAFKGNVSDYDLVIVDEAHENYLAKQMQSITSKIKYHLLLTGTPSKLIAKGEFKFIYLSMADLDRQYFSKTAIELVTSPYKWSSDDYNRNNELKTQVSDSINVNDTNKSLDIIIKKLIERVIYKNISPEQFNKPNIKSWITKLFTKNILGKTMFICASVNQANQVNDYLVSKGYSSKVSHSKSDFDSQLFDEHKEGLFDILVVVNRGRLGYNDESLMNIVDMSGTQNPDLIYQIFSRVVRGTQDQNKLYLKMAPSGPGMNDLTAVSVNMALSLMFEDVISKFNGKNMKGFQIAHKVENKIKYEINKEGKNKRKIVDKITFPEYTTDVIAELSDITFNLSDPASVYKSGEIGEIIKNIKLSNGLNYQSSNNIWTKEKAIEEAKKYSSKYEFSKNNRTAYYFLLNHKDDLNNVFNSNSPKKHHISYEDAVNIVKNVKTRGEFYKLGRPAVIIKRKYSDLINLIPSKKKQYTKSECINTMKKYKRRVDFRKKNSSMYNLVKRLYQKDMDLILPPNMSKVRKKTKSPIKQS
jgi:superfamily II DNA or RNA helicase